MYLPYYKAKWDHALTRNYVTYRENLPLSNGVLRNIAHRTKNQDILIFVIKNVYAHLRLIYLYISRLRCMFGSRKIKPTESP